MKFCIASTLLLLSAASSTAQDEPSRKIVWSEEFNGTEIDRSVWIHDVGGHGWGNGQLEFNTARSRNSYVADGMLTLEARREDYENRAFTSARMLTQGRFAFKYGTLEARIKVPNTADGVWPAFWMLGNNFPGVQWPKCGEIDILEIGSKGGIADGVQGKRINSALHFAGKDGNHTSLVEWHDAPVNLHEDFHRYRVDWTPERFDFYLDGEQFAGWEITGEEMREFQQPSFIILNLAVGSWPTAYTGVDSPDKVTAPFPSKMQVDWIRLYGHPETETLIGGNRVPAKAFGVFTESSDLPKLVPFTEPKSEETDAEDFEFGNRANLMTWNNLTEMQSPPTASEGEQCWAWQIEPGEWWGGGVFLPNPRNLQAFSDGYLHLDIKTTLAETIRIGIKSSRGGESWLPLGDESSEFGFKRDDEWHSISIPLNRFGNIDFQTVHQLLMVSGDAPNAAAQLAIDHVWWEPSAARQSISEGTYGVLTSLPDEELAGSFQFGQQGNFFVWEETMKAEDVSQEELSGGVGRGMRLTAKPDATWSGVAFTPNQKIDLSQYVDRGALKLQLKTRSQAEFRLGFKSGNLDGHGQAWIPFKPGDDPQGFKRDGEWHELTFRLKEFSPDVDFREVSQLFQLLGPNGPIENISLGEIRFVSEVD